MDRKEHIGFVLRTTANLFRRQIDNSAGKHGMEGLTGMQGRVIGFLCHNLDRDIFQRDIENEFSIRRSTATAILQTMEKRGLIRRESVESDGRLKRIIPCKAALEGHELFEKEIEAVEKAARKGISEEEIDAFFATLQKMKNNLNNLGE